MASANRKHGSRARVTRRELLRGALGSGAALTVSSVVAACSGPKAATKGPKKLPGGDFVFDVQTHHVDATEGAVWPVNATVYKTMFERISQARGCGRSNTFGCIDQDEYLRELFVQSETAMAVLLGMPGLIGKNPLDNYEIQRTRDRANKLGGRRVLSTGVVHPNLGRGELEGMTELAQQLRVSAWCVYTGWSPEGPGWWLDDPYIGPPFYARAKELNVPIVIAPKGLPWPNFDEPKTSPRDVGPAAKANPEIRFMIAHAGYDAEVVEGPYDLYGSPQTADRGVNRLIKSLEDSGLWPNQNVYVAIGGAWGLLMNKPEQAAHFLGKLIKHVGDERVLWGSDALWLGQPQEQITAFRLFEIPEEMQQKFGYPALTSELKERILGKNAAALFRIDPKAPRAKLRGADLRPRSPY